MVRTIVIKHNQVSDELVLRKIIHSKKTAK